MRSTVRLSECEAEHKLTSKSLSCPNHVRRSICGTSESIPILQMQCSRASDNTLQIFGFALYYSFHPQEPKACYLPATRCSRHPVPANFSLGDGRSRSGEKLHSYHLLRPNFLPYRPHDHLDIAVCQLYDTSNCSWLSFRRTG